VSAAPRTAAGPEQAPRRPPGDGSSTLVVCWRLDRLGRNLRHLIGLLDDLQVLGWPLSRWLRGLTPQRPLEGSRCTFSGPSPIRAGTYRREGEGGFGPSQTEGRATRTACSADHGAQLAEVAGMPLREAARVLGVPKSVLHRARLTRNPTGICTQQPEVLYSNR